LRSFICIPKNKNHMPILALAHFVVVLAHYVIAFTIRMFFMDKFRVLRRDLGVSTGRHNPRNHFWVLILAMLNYNGVLKELLVIHNIFSEGFHMCIFSSLSITHFLVPLWRPLRVLGTCHYRFCRRITS